MVEVLRWVLSFSSVVGFEEENIVEVGLFLLLFGGFGFGKIVLLFVVVFEMVGEG